MNFDSVPKCVKFLIFSFLDSKDDLLALRCMNRQCKALAEKRIDEIGGVCFLNLKRSFLALEDVGEKDPETTLKKGEEWRLMIKKVDSYPKKNVFKKGYYKIKWFFFGENKRNLVCEFFSIPDDSFSKSIFHKNAYRNLPIMEISNPENPYLEMEASAQHRIMRASHAGEHFIILRIQNHILGKTFALYAHTIDVNDSVEWVFCPRKQMFYDKPENAFSLLHSLHHRVRIDMLGKTKAYKLFKALVQKGDNGFDKLW